MPFFLVGIGLQVDPAVFAAGPLAALAVVLVLAAVASKLAGCGLGAIGRIVTSSGFRPNFLTTARESRALRSPGRVTPSDFPLRSSGRLISFRVTNT